MKKNKGTAAGRENANGTTNGEGSKFPSGTSYASNGLPARGFSALTPENDLSALVNANLALAQQNLEMSGRHTGAPDYNNGGGIRLSSGHSPTIAGPNSLPGARFGSLPSPSALLNPGLHVRQSNDENKDETPSDANKNGFNNNNNNNKDSSNMLAMYGNGSKRERGPSSAFFGTSFGVAGSFGSIFPSDVLGTSPSDRNGKKGLATKIDYYDDLNSGMSPDLRGPSTLRGESSSKGAKSGAGGRGLGGARVDANNQTDDDTNHNGTNFKVGSIGYMRDLDDALPIVGSIELGSPLDLGMMNSTPGSNKNNSKNSGISVGDSASEKISMRTTRNKKHHQEVEGEKKSNGTRGRRRKEAAKGTGTDSENLAALAASRKRSA